MLDHISIGKNIADADGFPQDFRHQSHEFEFCIFVITRERIPGILITLLHFVQVNSKSRRTILGLIGFYHRSRHHFQFGFGELAIPQFSSGGAKMKTGKNQHCRADQRKYASPQCRLVVAGRLKKIQHRDLREM